MEYCRFLKDHKEFFFHPNVYKCQRNSSRIIKSRYYFTDYELNEIVTKVWLSGINEWLNFELYQFKDHVKCPSD